MNRRLIVLLAAAGVTLIVGLALPQSEDDSAEALVAPRSASKAQPAGSAQTGPAPSDARLTAADRGLAVGTPTPASVPAASLRQTAAAPAGSSPQPSGRTLTRPGADLFPSPAPEVIKAALAPKVLPAPEFAFIGKVIDANVPMAIIRDGDRVNTLRQGDQHGGWRVTAIQDSGLQLAHLATGTEARLALGARAAPRPAQVSASADEPPQETDSEGSTSNDR
jgi:hypothetical protein